MKKYYTIYKVDTINNDLQYINEYEDIITLVQDYGLKNKKSIYNYIIDNLDKVEDLVNIKNLLKCKYIIMIDKEEV